MTQTEGITTQIIPVAERICVHCGHRGKDVLPGYWAHVGGKGDVWQKPACNDISECLKRQRQEGI